jgi:hypothetical protein
VRAGLGSRLDSPAATYAYQAPRRDLFSEAFTQLPARPRPVPQSWLGCTPTIRSAANDREVVVGSGKTCSPAPG